MGQCSPPPRRGDCRELHRCSLRGQGRLLLTGVPIAIAFFTFVAILFIPVTIIVLLVWLTVRLVQRHKARRLPPAAPGSAVPAGTGPLAAHIVVDAVPYRIRGADRGPGRVDLYCYDCSCGDVLPTQHPGRRAPNYESTCMRSSTGQLWIRCHAPTEFFDDTILESIAPFDDASECTSE